MDIDHANHQINCATPKSNASIEEQDLNTSLETLNNNCALPKSNAHVHEEQESPNQFQHLIDIRTKHPKKFMTAHLNINSLRNKFIEIKELLSDKIVDVLFISETKLDCSFRNSTLSAECYQLIRRDRDKHCSGIEAYVRSDLPSRRRSDLEPHDQELIVC